MTPEQFAQAFSSGAQNLMALSSINFVFSNLFGIACYVLFALGLYTLAKRRGIHHAWMAWVPVLRVYLLGCVSDQYRYVVKGQTRNKRKVLMTLTIIQVVLSIILAVLAVVFVARLFMYITTPNAEAPVNMILGGTAVIVLLALVVIGVAIAYAVFYFMALYDLYRSCDPENATLFLLLSIFISVTAPFFIFFSREKDIGMPPRRDSEQAPAPAAYAPPAYTPPAYDPYAQPAPRPAPEVDPWDRPAEE